MNLAHRNYVSTYEEFFDNTKKGGGWSLEEKIDHLI